MKNVFSSATILSGTIIGAGIFGIPYTISKIGVIPGIFYIILIGLINLAILFIFGEVVGRTKEEHQVSGYAEKYLGKWGKAIMTFTVMFGNLGAILVYMIGIGDFSFELLSPYIGGTPFLYSSLFFILASFAILVGLGMIVAFERIMVVMILFIVGFFVILGFPEMHIQNIVYVDFAQAFAPYGVLLFAFGGVSAVPEMRRYAKGDAVLKKSIILGIIFPMVVYVLFSIAVVGVTGKATSPEAIIGLAEFLGPGIVALGALLGVFTMGTSFLTLGIITKNLFVKDFNFNPVLAWVVTCFVPYCIYLLGLTDFITVVGIVGSVTGGLYGIMIIAMYVQAKKKGTEKPAIKVHIPRIFIVIFLAIFGLGVLLELINLFL